MKRRKLVLVGLAALLILGVLVPLVAAYVGPVPAAYAMTWRPWRQATSVEVVLYGPEVATGNPGLLAWQQLAEMRVTFADLFHGEQTEFWIFARNSSLLPWTPLSGGSGP